MPAWVIKWLGIKLLDRVGRGITAYLKDRSEARRTLREVREKIKQLKQAHTEEEIREIISKL